MHVNPHSCQWPHFHFVAQLSPLAREAEAEPHILELQASRLDSLALTGWEVDREGPSVLSLAVVDQCPVWPRFQPQGGSFLLTDSVQHSHLPKVT